MRLILIYMAVQAAIIIGLAITSPGLFAIAAMMGVVIYGGFIWFVEKIVKPPRRE